VDSQCNTALPLDHRSALEPKRLQLVEKSGVPKIAHLNFLYRAVRLREFLLRFSKG
jgi:hypothetical protein